MRLSRAYLFFMVVALIIGSIACSSIEAPADIVEAPTPNSETQRGEVLKVHFIDVGQADAILIQGPKGENIVIDAGNNSDSEKVTDYLRLQGVKELKAVVGTHPHEDHIGGLDAVIRSFAAEKVYLPKVTHTSDTFRDVLKAVSDKGIKVATAVKGVSIPLAGMKAEFIGPAGADYESLNNHSAVVKLTYGKTSFLFQGDAEEISERDILKSEMGSKLKAEVLKLGHHGSSSSTIPEYLERVNPKYAVIMVGKENDYGHPHRETMELLKSKGIAVYRTDKSGTIIAESDGENISFNVNPDSNGYGSENKAAVKPYVDGAGNGLIKGNINSKGEKIYHLPGGANYNKTIPEKWFKTEQEAQAEGFRPSGK